MDFPAKQIKSIHDLLSMKLPGHAILVERHVVSSKILRVTITAPENTQNPLPEVPEEPEMGRRYSWQNKEVVCVLGTRCSGCVLLGGGRCIETKCDGEARKDETPIVLIEVPDAN